MNNTMKTFAQVNAIRLWSILALGALLSQVAHVSADHTSPPVQHEARVKHYPWGEVHPRVHGGSIRLVSGECESCSVGNACGTCAGCQAGTGCANCERRIDGVDCAAKGSCGEAHWGKWGPIPFQAFNQGEFIGPPRKPYLDEYRIRVDDEIEFVFIADRTEMAGDYQLQVGDKLKIESTVDKDLTREVTIQPDGTVDLLYLNSVRASRRTAAEFKAYLDEAYKKYYKVTDITVTRITNNTQLTDVLDAVNSRFFTGGLGKRLRVTPEGTVGLPAAGTVYVQGLTLQEVEREVNERYRMVVSGVHITPNLAQRAPRFLYVVGEVRNPGRYNMDAPTTVMQAIALAGGWNNGGNLRQVVIFRRAEDWRLLATRVDIRGALYGRRPSPSDEIFLRDSDIIVVPKSSVQATDDAIDLLFTRGLYRVLPMTFDTRL